METIKNLTKVLLTAIALLVLPTKAKADVEIFTLTNGLPILLSATPIIVDNISVFASSGTNMVVRFYDASTAKTNVVRAEYTAYTSYSTNFSVVFTNEASLLVTNTFVGTYTAPVLTSAVTNALPTVYVTSAPANTIVSKDVQIQTIRGLSANPSASGELILTYRRPAN